MRSAYLEMSVKGQHIREKAALCDSSRNASDAPFPNHTSYTKRSKRSLVRERFGELSILLKGKGVIEARDLHDKQSCRQKFCEEVNVTVRQCALRVVLALFGTRIFRTTVFPVLGRSSEEYVPLGSSERNLTLS